MKNSIKENTDKMGLFFAGIFSLIIVMRWWYYIDAYSVNILFYDQWDFYDALFNHKNWWEIFRWQSGPHRQGAGLIVTKVVADISHWNTRAESVMIGGIVCLAMVLAVILKTKLKSGLDMADVAIPLIFLTPTQYEIFAGTPFLAIGSVPLLLLMLYCLAWIARRGLTRYVTVLVINFLLIYTGYGLFVGMITPCLFGMEAWHAYRAHDRMRLCLAFSGIAIALVSAGSFFIGYHFQSGIESFQFPVREYWLYPRFMALMLANFCGIKGCTPFAYAAGFLMILLMVIFIVFHSVRSLRPEPDVSESSIDAVIVILITFTLIFCTVTAIGRVSLGLETAQASRYVTNMIPGFFGIYLGIVSLLQNVWRRILLVVAVVCLIAASFPLRKADDIGLTWYMQGKSNWKAVYLLTDDIETATLTARFPIYPEPERTHLKQKLEYLKKHKLNLYLDAPVQGLIRSVNNNEDH